MNPRLGHVTVGGKNARAVADFYRTVIGLEPAVTLGAQNVDPNSYKWLKLGDTELHIVELDTSMHERLGLAINPMNPHVAIELDSAEEIREMADRLTKAGIKWIDFSPHGIPGRHQMFMVDPGGNLVEFLLGSKAA